jgi:hypothetical protein
MEMLRPVRSQAVLGWLSAAALLVLVLSGILYAVFWFVGLNEATEYRGHGSSTTESWLRIASFGIRGSGVALLLLWLLSKVNERLAGTAATGDSEG